ncbi:MAG: hypothetical protein AAFS07_18795 [Pseudomonadota bacterium]
MLDADDEVHEATVSDNRTLDFYFRTALDVGRAFLDVTTGHHAWVGPQCVHTVEAYDRNGKRTDRWCAGSP